MRPVHRCAGAARRREGAPARADAGELHRPGGRRWPDACADRLAAHRDGPFIDKLLAAEARARLAAVRRPRPRAGEVSRRLAGRRRRASSTSAPRIVDATQDLVLRLQAADRLLRRPARRGPARAADGAHPQGGARGAGDPRRQARRHRLDRRAVRPRGVRALPGRRGDVVAASWASTRSSPT